MRRVLPVLIIDSVCLLVGLAGGDFYCFSCTATECQQVK